VGEHSELLIDDFVYDPNSSSGSLGLKVAMGTVKYASGSIAHNNPDTVDIQTPSATIAVRGTAFSMTVDELGSSLVILLPNFDGSVGEIIVGTDAGQVILNKAFQATSVSGRDAKPKQPVILAIDESMINNLLIIAPPKRVVKELIEENKNNPLAINFLDYDELGEDLLASTDLEFDTLTINELITSLLGNMLANVFNSSENEIKSLITPMAQLNPSSKPDLKSDHQFPPEIPCISSWLNSSRLNFSSSMLFSIYKAIRMAAPPMR
jgi:hypothetical protein